MKVIYSVGAVVPGGGIGNVSFHALKALSEHRYLDHAFLVDTQRGFLTDQAVTTYPFLKKVPYYLLKDNLFDWLVSKQITKTTIFHGWNNFSLFSMKKAKKLGALTVIERASSHILAQKELLEKEMTKFGVKNTPVHPLTLKKSLSEYEQADYIFVPSQFVYQSFLDQGIGAEKLKLIHFGVGLSKFKALGRKDDGIFRAIFVGQVGVRKGVPYLLQAWEELALKDSELLLIGPVFPDLVSIIKNYSLKNVKMVSYSHNLAKFYQKSDVFVFPSIEEGSALVVFEALASGLPVITTPNSGSVVENNKEGLIVPAGEVGRLKEALLKLYNDRALLKSYSNNAISTAKKYSWENYESNLIKTYEEIGT